jgi:hypothetical protein
MVNIYKIKRWGAGFLSAFFPTMVFLIMIVTTGDLFQAILGFMITIPLVIVIASKLTAHPILDYLEGKGLLVLTLDSTGVIDSFIVGVDNPYLKGKVGNKDIETIFDREGASYLGAPKKVAYERVPNQDPNIEELVLKIPKDEQDSILFGFRHFPVLIYNKNMQTFLTKDILMQTEKDIFVKHQVLYLNRKIEELTSILRDFARHVVEQMRPKAGLQLGGWFKWVILFVIIVILAIMLLPFIAPAGEAVGGAALPDVPAIVTPIG